MIRPLREEDLDQVEAIEKDSFGKGAWDAETFRFEVTKNPCGHIDVLEEGGRILGYVGWWDMGDRMEITTFAIRKECRRRGWGSALMEYAIRTAEDHRMKNITLEVRVSNEPAIRLYEKHGFQIWARKKDYYIEGHEDAWVMGRGAKE